MVILVTGAKGQLGQAIESIANLYSEFKFIYTSSIDLDITNSEKVNTFFNQNKIDFCINSAAYTAVDKAETEIEKAHLVNVSGPENLAKACLEKNAILVHISTDFVFEGNKNCPYVEEDQAKPINIYGETKLKGEKIIASILKKHIIVRTSWVYSQFANNFMKTMLRLASEREALNVVNDQFGTPTQAVDLAHALLKIIKKIQEYNLTDSCFGTYHFSNEGSCSWFEFAKEIFKQKKSFYTSESYSI